MRWPSLASRPARLRMAVEPTSRPTSQLTRRDTCDRASRESCGHKRGPAGTGQGIERIDAEDDVDKGGPAAKRTRPRAQAERQAARRVHICIVGSKFQGFWMLLYILIDFDGFSLIFDEC